MVILQIVLKDVSKRYDYPVQCLALHNINIEISKGETIALMGKSGCGKSTLLNIIAGLTELTTGQYLFNGIQLSNNKNVLAKFRKNNIGIIVQNFALLNDRNIYENIKLSLSHDKKAKETIINVAEALNIKNKLKYFPYQLSGGECQRVAIARAIVKKPNIVLADEPTGALDSINGQTVINILKELSCEGTTLIIATHDKSIGYQCNRIIEIKDGTI